jgi:erythromycin esterase-like protein
MGGATIMVRTARLGRREPKATSELIDHIRGAARPLQAFDRWPTWMWANEEIAELTDWLRRHNETRPEAERVGFYGLDVYNWTSIVCGSRSTR